MHHLGRQDGHQDYKYITIYCTVIFLNTAKKGLQFWRPF
jgi:hypothetical protein